MTYGRVDKLKGDTGSFFFRRLTLIIGPATIKSGVTGHSRGARLWKLAQAVAALNVYIFFKSFEIKGGNTITYEMT